jgi:hypothetical protein
MDVEKFYLPIRNLLILNDGDDRLGDFLHVGVGECAKFADKTAGVEASGLKCIGGGWFGESILLGGIETDMPKVGGKGGFPVGNRNH